MPVRPRPTIAALVLAALLSACSQGREQAKAAGPVASEPRAQAPVPKPADDAPPPMRKLTSAALGLSFRHPAAYFARETNPAGGPAAVTLYEDTPDNRALLEGRAERDREGPVAISITAFPGPPPVESLDAWIKATRASGFHLSSDQTLSETAIAGIPARRYRWSGLYEGESVAFEHAGRIIVASVTFMQPQATIRRDFGQLLETVELLPAQ